MITFIVVTISLFLFFGWWTSRPSKRPAKPKPPSRTIWACGWSNPLPNPTYEQEWAEYVAALAEWNAYKVRKNRPAPRKPAYNAYCGVNATGRPSPPRPR